MILHDNILYVTREDLKLAKSTFAHNVSVGNINAIQIPGKGVQKFVEYETMPEKYKLKVLEEFGNPYVYVGNSLINRLLEVNPQDYAFIKSYDLGNGRSLPDVKVNQYLEASKVVYLLYRIDQFKKKHGNRQNCLSQFTGFKTTKDFSEALINHVRRLKKTKKAAGITSNYAKLITKRNEYADLVQIGEAGIKCLIHKNYLNNHASKTANEGFEETQFAMLLQLCAHQNNLENTTIADTYNAYSKANGLKTITPQTVANFKKQYAKEVLAGTRGYREFATKAKMHHKRKRPTAPLTFLSVDGWLAELAYQENIDGRQVYHNRLTVVVVLDVFNNYPLGYAIGERENAALITAAMQNAVDHCKELTGDYYHLMQLQTDRFAKKAMEPIYNAVAVNYVPAKVGNAKGKPVEAYFNYLNRSYAKKLPNWTGNNITSRPENQPNFELKLKNQSSLPTKEECYQLLDMMIQAERNKKHQDWLEAFTNADDKYKVKMTINRYLKAFGTEKLNKNGKHTSQIKGEGLGFQLDGIKYVFDSFDPAFRDRMKDDWRVIYNAKDMSSILAISEQNGAEFVLESKYESPMALIDQDEDDFASRKAINDYNKNMELKVVETFKNTQEQVQHELSTNPGLLDSGLKMLQSSNGVQKDYLNEAKVMFFNQSDEERKAHKKALKEWEDAEYERIKKQEGM